MIGVMLLSMAAGVLAQEEDDISSSGGNFTAAVLFGRGQFISVPNAPSAPGYNYNWSVDGSAPITNVSGNYNDVANMIGVECRYFVSDAIAIKLSGAGILRHTPQRDNVPAVIDPNGPNAAWIPAYNAVKQQNHLDVFVNLGGEYHLSSSFEKVSPYVGISVPFMYGRRSQYDPTIEDNHPLTGLPYAVDVSVRHTQVMSFGGQIAAGVDYALQEALFIGFEFKPFSYWYTFSEKMPAAGLETLQADTHTFAFFSQVNFKVGFKF